MTIAALAVFCVFLVILAFLAPRFSRRPEREGSRLAGAPTRVTGKAPGSFGRWLSKPFRSGQKAIHKSGSTGRKGRGKMPFRELRAQKVSRGRGSSVVRIRPSSSAKAVKRKPSRAP